MELKGQQKTFRGRSLDSGLMVLEALSTPGFHFLRLDGHSIIFPSGACFFFFFFIYIYIYISFFFKIKNKKLKIKVGKSPPLKSSDGRRRLLLCCGRGTGLRKELPGQSISSLARIKFLAHCLRLSGPRLRVCVKKGGKD